MSSEAGAERGVYADRVFRYAMPQWALHEALTDRRSLWLRLQPGEVEPRVLRAVGIELVVWSSLWPVSSGDTIEFSLSTDDLGSGSVMRMRWLSSSPPDERGIAITRQRLSRKFGADLRGPSIGHRWQSCG